MARREGQVARTLRRQRVEWEDAVEDPRDSRGRRHGHHGLLNLLVLGFASGMATLRRIEDLSGDLSRKARRVLGIVRRVSDTTLYMLLSSQTARGMRETLRRQVKTLWERKAVSNDAFPIGVVSLDGKSIWTSKWKNIVGAKEQALESGETLSSFAMLDAVLTSSSVAPCLDIQLIPEKSGEAPASREMVRRLVANYGVHFEIITGDAGLTCRETAQLIREQGKHFLLGLKGNQPTLLQIAENAFAELVSPSPQRAFAERRSGATVQRALRTLTVRDVPAFAEFGAEEVWQVMQETRHDSGSSGLDVRYFIVSLPPRRLSPSQKLALVRLHWAIENNHHWTLDAQMGADAHQPCQLSSQSLEVTCWLRALGYNVLAARRGLKRQNAPRTAWQRVQQKLRDLFVFEVITAEPSATLV